MRVEDAKMFFGGYLDEPGWMKIRNEHITGTVQAGHKVRVVRNRWFAQVQRSNGEYIRQRMLNMELPGWRKRKRA